VRAPEKLQSEIQRHHLQQKVRERYVNHRSYEAEAALLCRLASLAF